jgi:ribosomal 50S subunit-recycling heat shock protein
VKPGDIIGISFGNRETRVEVLTVQDNVRKEAAADMFRYLPVPEEAAGTSTEAAGETSPETEGDF